jgi:hypothetical protein
MAKTTSSIADGLWTDGGTWNNGVPADGDTVNIGHLVTYNADMSAYTTGAIININSGGTLKASESAGTYYLKLGGLLSVNSGGILQAGTSTSTPYPANCTFIIDGNNGSGYYIRNNGGAIKLYCAEPQNKAVYLTQMESAGATTLHIDTNLDSDTTYWKNGNSIAIANYQASSYSTWEYRIIDTISGQTITITSGLTAQKVTNSVIVVTTRNIQIQNFANYGIRNYSNSGINEVSFAGYGTTGLFSCDTEPSVPFKVVGGVYYNMPSATFIYLSPFEVSNCLVLRVSNYLISGQGIFTNVSFFATCPYALLSYNSGSQFSNCLFWGLVYLGQYNISKTVIKDSVIKKCAYVLYQSSGITFYNCNFIENTTYLFYNSTINLDSCVIDSGITICALGMANNTGFGTLAMTKYNTNCSPSTYFYSTNHNQVLGAFKSWSYGGITTLQDTVYPPNYLNSYKTDFENVNKMAFYQIPVSVAINETIKYRIYLRKTASMVYCPTVQLLKEGETNDPLLNPNATILASGTMSDSIDTWEIIELTYTNSEPFIEI